MCPCKFCDTPTPMTGTQLCDGCWNVERGLRAFLYLPKGREHVIQLLHETSPGYDPSYGDERECVCGHPYYRHFDTYDDMADVGCKYCLCDKFSEK